MSVRGMSLHHSIPNPRFFSSSSVPQSAFLGPPRRSKLANNALGKRSRSYRYSPELIDEQSRKRPRRSAPSGYALGSHDRQPSPPPPQAARWHQNDRFVRKFDREELERAIGVNPTVSSQIAQFPLGNDEFLIHPMFRSLTGLMPELYPSLRLATRFLFSRHTLPFFHSLITCPLTFLQLESQYYNVPLTHLPPSPYQAAGLPDAERNLTLQTLLALAPHISLHISPDPRLAVRWAYTERITPPQHCTTGLASAYSILPQLFPTPAQLHSNNNDTDTTNPLLALGFRGTNALINLSPCFLRTLHPHTFPAPTAAQKLRCAFMLAVTLIHELAHAVYMCRFPGAPLIPDPNPTEASSSSSSEPDQTHRPTQLPICISLSNGKPFPHPLPSSHLLAPTTTPPSRTHQPRTHKAYPDQEPFYATHRKPELGHAWETTVFAGGKILSLAACDAFSLGLGWQRWPDAHEVYVQNWRGETVPLQRQRRRGETEPDFDTAAGGTAGGTAGGAPKWETVYVVSDAWVWRWFLRAFWERVEDEGLGEVARVEKGLGARVRNYDWVDRGTGDDGWEAECSSRGRGADGAGVVREGQAWVESESESGSECECEDESGDD